MEEETYSSFMNFIRGDRENTWFCIDKQVNKNGEYFHLWEYTGDDIQSAFPIVKCEGILHCSLEKVYEIMMFADLKTRQKWDTSLIKCEIVKTVSPTNHIMHFAYKTPFPVKNRDFCVQRFSNKEKISTHGKNHRYRYILVGVSIVDDEIIPVSSKYTRGEILISGYLIEEQTENTCKIVSINHVDPRGSIPKMVINLTKTRLFQNLIKFSHVVQKIARDC